MVVPQNGWFIVENPIYKWMIGGHPYFRKFPHDMNILTNISIRNAVVSYPQLQIV